MTRKHFERMARIFADNAVGDLDDVVPTDALDTLWCVIFESCDAFRAHNGDFDRDRFLRFTLEHAVSLTCQRCVRGPMGTREERIALVKKVVESEKHMGSLRYFAGLMFPSDADAVLGASLITVTQKALKEVPVV